MLRDPKRPFHHCLKTKSLVQLLFSFFTPYFRDTVVTTMIAKLCSLSYITVQSILQLSLPNVKGGTPCKIEKKLTKEEKREKTLNSFHPATLQQVHI